MRLLEQRLPWEERLPLPVAVPFVVGSGALGELDGQVGDTVDDRQPAYQRRQLRTQQRLATGEAYFMHAQAYEYTHHGLQFCVSQQALCRQENTLPVQGFFLRGDLAAELI